MGSETPRVDELLKDLFNEEAPLKAEAMAVLALARTLERTLATRDETIRLLEEKCEGMRKERDRYHDALIARHGGEPIALLAELDDARKALEAAERDARRYRWLRDNERGVYWCDDILGHVPGVINGEWLTGDNLDAVIDSLSGETR